MCGTSYWQASNIKPYMWLSPQAICLPYENHCILGYLVLVKNLLLAFPVNDRTSLNRFLSGTHSWSLQTDNGSFV